MRRFVTLPRENQGNVESAVPGNLLPRGPAPPVPQRKRGPPWQHGGRRLPEAVGGHESVRRVDERALPDHRVRVAAARGGDRCPRLIRDLPHLLSGERRRHHRFDIRKRDAHNTGAVGCREHDQITRGQHIRGVTEVVAAADGFEAVLTRLVVPQRKAIGISEDRQVADSEGHNGALSIKKAAARRGSGLWVGNGRKSPVDVRTLREYLPHCQ
jgi:hypothetical protein